ncbi:MAG TPA: nuclear transport factor 2 family protein [Solirubrobacteraceae bacterium]|nr:nuclear transport factor 2 family protein [Solirubrobacteraceae bacterium]
MEELVEAMMRKDAAAVASFLAEGVVLRSPISRRIVFRGRDQIRELFEVVYDLLDTAHVDAIVGEGDTRVLLLRASVGRLLIDEAMALRLDDRGRVTEMKLYVRAMPQLVTFAAILGPPLAARRSRARAIALKALFAPLALFVNAGEPLGVRLSGAGEPVDPRT